MPISSASIQTICYYFCDSIKMNGNNSRRTFSVFNQDNETSRPRKARNTGQILGTGDERDVIYERILNAIMEHRLLPGTKLVEEKLANVFHVNRTRIREVLGPFSLRRHSNDLPEPWCFYIQPIRRRSALYLPGPTDP
ncbi:GntR family transcriptional regulator [Klebsiella pneumoniae]